MTQPGPLQDAPLRGRQRHATVLVADDHPLFREGIERAVRERPDLQLVGTAADGRQALEGIVRLTPHVAVLDLRLPLLDGLSVLNAVVRDAIATRVMLLSASADPEIVYRALQQGACGYFRKEADRDTILGAIAAVARGRTMVDPELQTAVFEQIRRHRVDDDRPLLTSREREVLGLVADGCSAPDIAARLVLSVATVKTHQARLYEKLGVSDRAAAVAEAMRRGLLE